jgi:tetratricopeptide (TPR) repeat protein
LEANADAERLQRLAGSLWRFWYLHSHFAEGRRRLGAAIALDGGRTPARATVLRGACVMEFNLSNIPTAIRYAEEALALDRDLGNDWGVAYATMMIGNSLSEAFDETRDLPAARDRLAEAARLFERIGDEHFGLIARHNQAWIVEVLGDPAEAKRLYEEDLSIARKIGNGGIEADSLAQLGMSARDEGRLGDAVGLLRESLAIDHRRGMTGNVATNLGRLANLLARRGEVIDAARLMAAEQALTEQLGSSVPWWAKERDEETLALLREGLDPDALERAMGEGAALSVDDAMRIVRG